MKKGGNIVSYTEAELEAMRAHGESQTDWARVDAMTEEELEAAIASDPDWADIPRDWYEHATPHYLEAMRKQVSLRIDPGILDWFKRQGPDYFPHVSPGADGFVLAASSLRRMPGWCSSLKGRDLHDRGFEIRHPLAPTAVGGGRRSILGSRMQGPDVTSLTNGGCQKLSVQPSRLACSRV